MQKFIVAEITKNWDKQTPVNDLLCQRFEAVININSERGYKLIDWKITSATNNDILTETIIAIFELKSKITMAKKKETYTDKQIQEWKAKAEKWDDLDEKIGKFYLDENGEELEDDEGGDLVDIGEAAAMAFGYL